MSEKAYRGNVTMSPAAVDDEYRAMDAARNLKKKPVAWRVKDFADGWIVFQDEADALRYADEAGAVIQGLYVRDGT